jgi:hypothetical protein
MAEPVVLVHSASCALSFAGTANASEVILYVPGARSLTWEDLGLAAWQALLPWPTILGLPGWAWEEV